MTISPHLEANPVSTLVRALSPPVLHVEDLRTAERVSRLKRIWPAIGEAADHPFAEFHLKQIPEFVSIRPYIWTFLIIAGVAGFSIYFNSFSTLAIVLIMFFANRFSNPEVTFSVGKLFVKPSIKHLGPLWMTGIQMPTIMAIEIASREYWPRFRYGRRFELAIWISCAVAEIVWGISHRIPAWGIPAFVIMQIGVITAWIAIYIIGHSSELHAYNIITTINRGLDPHIKPVTILLLSGIVLSVGALVIYLVYRFHSLPPPQLFTAIGAGILTISLSIIYYLRVRLPKRLDRDFIQMSARAQSHFQAVVSDESRKYD